MNSDPTDAELLQRYAEQACEDAFAEIVRRHLRLVYGCALRRVGGDAHLARDVAQQVFLALAQQAAALRDRTTLGGWLFTTARFTAAGMVRTERRRQQREQEAHTMIETGPEPNWEHLRPVLDESIEELEERDRDAVLLRFFEGRTFAEIGARLNLTENAARMRVERALDKMHGLLSRRGISSSTAALALALSGHASVSVPAGLAASVTAAVVAGSGGAAAVGAGAAAAGATATFMSMTNLQLGFSGVLAVAAATAFVVQAGTNSDLEREAIRLRAESAAVASLETENLRLARTVSEVADLGRDDAELTRLQQEADALRTTLRRIARAQEERAAANQVRAIDRLPKPTLQPRPDYPVEMRAAGISGEVVVSFVVDSKGEVRNALVRRSTRTEFERAALAAVSNWKFDPGVKSNRAVNTRMQVPVVFTIEGAAARTEAAGPSPYPVVHDGPENEAAVLLEPFVVMSRRGPGTESSASPGRG